MTAKTAYFYDKDGRIIRVVSGDAESVEFEQKISYDPSVTSTEQVEASLVVEQYFVDGSNKLSKKRELKTLYYNNDVPVGQDIRIENIPINTKVTMPSGLSEIVDDGSVVLNASQAGKYKFIVDNPAYLVEEFTIVTDPPPSNQIDVETVWGAIGGNMVDQPDLQSALDAKAQTNHDHTAADIVSGTLAYARLPIDSTDVANWNLAYGWGNHANAGYLISETDPVFSVSPAGAISAAQITNWDNAYSWGNHSTAGYLTSVGWLDVTGKPTVFPPEAHSHGYADLPITSVQVANWELAYSWGDHSTAGYLTAVDWAIITGKPATATRWPAWSEVTSKPSTFTPSAHTHAAADVTSGVFAVARIPQGSRSTLDADTVDGQHASAFLGVNDRAADSNLLNGINSSQFLRSDTTDYLTGVQYLRADIRNEDAHRDHGIYGDYSSTKTNHIWSMGSAYRNAANGVDFGTLYGLAYYHPNNGQGTLANGHQMVWCHNGNPRSAMGTGIWTSGSGTATDWHATSDIKFKKNIRPLEDALSGVLQLRGVRYKQKADEENRERIGVIAQEMEKVYPEFVVTHDENDPEKAYKTVNYPKLTAVLVEAIKEQNQTIENQQAQLNRLEAKLNKLLGE